MAIITISRGSMSGGQAMAEQLGKQLGYPTVARQVIQGAATEIGVPEEELLQHIERAPKWWDRHGTTRRVYVTAVQAALLEHAAGGHLVYHGLAGQFLLRGLPAVLRVRLIAPISTRVRTLMDSEQIGAPEAAARIQDIDRMRARWVKMMYGEDIEDPALYDLVVNVDDMPMETACALVVATVKRPEFEVTDDVAARLADFRLACQVKLALVRAPETRGLDLEAKAHDSVVEVSGGAPLLATGETGDRITTIASAVRGVTDVRLKLEWFDPYP